jgi:pyruvate/2-oxoglutarate/acetoin dehydrogenase E1 component
VIECLNGYRLKEKLPENYFGLHCAIRHVPEVVKEGTDVTIVSYGSTLAHCAGCGVGYWKSRASVVKWWMCKPCCLSIFIIRSWTHLKKTNSIVFVDEDVPGGAAAYMFNKVMEEQGGYRWLDVAPRTITGKAHRPLMEATEIISASRMRKRSRPLSKK